MRGDEATYWVSNLPATPRCVWCSRRAHPGSVRSAKTFSPLIGGGHECKDNIACAERMRKKGL